MKEIISFSLFVTRKLILLVGSTILLYSKGFGFCTLTQFDKMLQARFSDDLRDADILRVPGHSLLLHLQV